MLTPIELVKCQMQVPSLTTSATTTTTATAARLYPPNQAPSALAIIASIFKYRGILGFWHGQLGTLIRETGGSAAWFGSYEGISEVFHKHEESRRQNMGQYAPDTPLLAPAPAPAVALPIYQQLIAGAIAGMSYNFIFFPADTIKSRMQTAEVAMEHPHITSGNGSVIKGAQAPILLVDRRRQQQQQQRRQSTFWKVGKELWKEQGLRGMYRGCGITVARAAPSSAFIFLVFEELKGRFGTI